jgi:transporter family-2 protein
MTLLLVLVAAAAGISVALQGQFMGAMDRAVGTATSVLITYAVGASLALLIWLTRRPTEEIVRNIPWYSWFAGVTGLVIVSGIGYAAPRLGLSRTLVISVAAQLIVALIIEHYGLFNSVARRFEYDRAIGLALVVGGVWLVLKR